MPSVFADITTIAVIPLKTRIFVPVPVTYRFPPIGKHEAPAAAELGGFAVPQNVCVGPPSPFSFRGNSSSREMTSHDLYGHT